MRVYQLYGEIVSNALETGINCDIKTFNVSDPMECAEFIKYYETQSGSVLTEDDLDALPVGNTSICNAKTGQSQYIKVTVIPKKLRLYSLDNGHSNDIQLEYNLAPIAAVKPLLKHYFNIMMHGNHEPKCSCEPTINVEKICSDTYLESLESGLTQLYYDIKYCNGCVLGHNLNIMVHEFII